MCNTFSVPVFWHGFLSLCTYLYRLHLIFGASSIPLIVILNRYGISPHNPCCSHLFTEDAFFAAVILPLAFQITSSTA